MLKYRILEANSAKELESLVNKEMIKNKCALIGGASIRQEFISRNEWTTCYIQTMTIDVDTQ
jgi:hypothetical protein